MVHQARIDDQRDRLEIESRDGTAWPLPPMLLTTPPVPCPLNREPFLLPEPSPRDDEVMLG